MKQKKQKIPKISNEEIIMIKSNKTKKWDVGIYSLFEDLIKTLNWYHFIPIIGIIIYSFKINVKMMEVPPFYKKAITRFYNLNTLINLAISIPVLICWLVIEWHFKPGGMPVIFWVNLAIFLPFQLQPFWTRFLYIKGLDRYKRIAERD